MRYALLLLACLSMNAIAAPCQVKLVLSADGNEVVSSTNLTADQLIAKQTLTNTIEEIIEASKAAGLELVEESDYKLSLDLHTKRDGDKITGTSIDTKLVFENKYSAVTKVEFSHEASLPFLARVGLSNRAKAQVKELEKRVLDATRDISALPGCR